MRSDYFDVNRFVDAELHTALLREFDKPGAPDLFTCRGDCRRTLPRNHRDVLGRSSFRGPKAVLCRRCQFTYDQDRQARRFDYLTALTQGRSGAGLCRRCGADPAPGKKHCARCLEDAAARQRSYQAKQKGKST